MQQRLLIPTLLLIALGLSACGNKGPLVPKESVPAPAEKAAAKPKQAPEALTQ